MNSYQKFQIRCRVLSACFASLAVRAASSAKHLIAHRARCYAAQAAFPTYATEAQLMGIYRELSAAL